MTDDAYDTMNDWLTPNGQKPQEPYIGMRLGLAGNKTKRFDRHHDMIYNVYLKNKELVNDDADMFAAICEPLWDNSLSLRDNLRRLPRSETLTRRRRELHEAGLITYSPKAMKTRTEAFKKERDKASPMSPQAKRVYYDEVQEVGAEIYKQTRLV